MEDSDLDQGAQIHFLMAENLEGALDLLQGASFCVHEVPRHAKACWRASPEGTIAAQIDCPTTKL